jgi:hypothetical protein
VTSTYMQELQKGSATYRFSISTDASGETVLDLVGTTSDGGVVADGRIRLPSSDGIEIGKTLGRALSAQSRLTGGKPKATNAGTPWSDELDEQLKTAWLELTPTDNATKHLKELATAMQRTPTAIRARLPRVGCDPDIPGRQLSLDAASVFGIQQQRSDLPEK